VTGRIERGIVKVGEEIEIVGIADRQNHLHRRGNVPQNCLTKVKLVVTSACCCAAPSVKTSNGQVLAKPGSIKPHASRADLCLVEKDEGGRHTPFFNNYRPTVLLPHDGRDWCDRVARRQRNGHARRQRVDHGQVDQPDRDGRRSAHIHEGGRTVGVARGAKILA
jgi:elongation factor Tu